MQQKQTRLKRQKSMPKEITTSQLNKKKQEQPLSGYYGAQKSRNEIYFQIASVFREASRDDTRLATAWMHRILMTKHAEHPDNSGKMVVNSI